MQPLVLLLFVCLSVFGTQAQTSSQKLVTLWGRVVDARTGEPIAKVRVIASGNAAGAPRGQIAGDQSTTTDD